MDADDRIGRVEHGHPVSAVDLEPVRGRDVAAGGVQHRGRDGRDDTRRELELRPDGIGLRPLRSARLERTHADDVAPGQPEDLVDVMDGGQERRMDARVGLRDRAGAVAPGRDREDAPEPAVDDLPSERLVGRREAEDVRRHEHRPGPCRRLDHPLGAVDGRGDGLLDEDADPTLEREAGRLDVLVLDGRDADAVGRHRVQHRRDVIERRLDPEAVRELGGAGGRARDEPDDADIRTRGVRAQVRDRHPAAADDRDTKRALVRQGSIALRRGHGPPVPSAPRPRPARPGAAGRGRG